jgi:hypothetical protein
MEPNIYSPPQSDVSVKNAEPGSIRRAVTIAVLIDIGGTILISFALMVLYGIYLGLNGVTPQEISTAISEISPWSALGIVATVIGCLISVYSGYKCSEIANQNSYKATIMTACIGVTFGVLIGASSYSVGETIFLSALTAGSIFGGSWLFQSKHFKA